MTNREQNLATSTEVIDKSRSFDGSWSYSGWTEKQRRCNSYC